VWSFISSIEMWQMQKCWKGSSVLLPWPPSIGLENAQVDLWKVTMKLLLMSWTVKMDCSFALYVWKVKKLLTEKE